MNCPRVTPSHSAKGLWSMDGHNWSGVAVHPPSEALLRRQRTPEEVGADLISGGGHNYHVCMVITYVGVIDSTAGPLFDSPLGSNGFGHGLSTTELPRDLLHVTEDYPALGVAVGQCLVSAAVHCTGPRREPGVNLVQICIPLSTGEPFRWLRSDSLPVQWTWPWDATRRILIHAGAAGLMAKV